MQTTTASPPKATATDKPSRKRPIARYVVLSAYIALVAWLAIHHEPWRDEADVWLMVRDNSLSELFRLAHYCGSPLLWHMLMWPFAKLGAPSETMAVVNALLAFVTASVLLFRAPFSLFAKTLILFSYLFSYEFPIITRSYQLSVLLIFCLAAMHQRRKETPFIYSIVLALLANTNVHGLVVACSIIFCNVVEQIKTKTHLARIAAFALPALIGVVLSVVQLIPPADGQFAPSMVRENWWVIPLSIRQAFAPTIANMDHSIMPMYMHTDNYGELYMPMLCLAGVLYALRKSPWGLSVYCLSSFGLMSLFVFKYSGHVRHWGFFVVMAIYAIWITRDHEALKPIRSNPYVKVLSQLLILVALLASTSTAWEAWVMDTQRPFSGGKAAADFLKERKLDKLPIAAYRNYAAESLSIYLPGTKFYYPEIRAYGTNMKWNKGYSHTLTNRGLLKRLNAHFGDKEYVLVLSGQEFRNCYAQGFERVYTTAGTVITADEFYSIFVRRKADR